jgi:DNA (cytosine-5)-methyltransferase 1
MEAAVSHAYYNENDKFAAAWLKELIKAGHIAAGDVDDRSIEDVTPNDLRTYTQCHFFAGIGGWSYALRLAGWPDDKRVWTGSCPCQPFSAAGQRKGIADERHLWPSWFHLIEQCGASVVFGEQVTASLKHGWLDLVQDDLEGAGYTVAAHGIAACNLGAPHQRKRLYFVADTRSHTSWSTVRSDQGTSNQLAGSSDPEWLVKPTSEQMGISRLSWEPRSSDSRLACGRKHQRESGSATTSSGTFWSTVDWIYCRDEKYRPVEPGTFPLAHGVSNRMGKLRGYGNAIVPQVAQAFIESYLGTL